MRKLLYLLITLCLIYITVQADEPVKRIILEQHTGAWCGWCVDGTVVMDEVMHDYPEQVIGVKVHNGDGMVIPEQAEIASALGLTGYPNGNVDRKPYNGAVFISRGDWRAAVEALLDEPPTVDVSMFYEIDEDSRVLTATITATILEQVSPNITFNMMIMEDSCSGTGSDWDQSNYLSGRAGYEDNPYYDLPSKITGYQHMKVVRAFAGGSWGVPGEFESGVTVGNSYTHVFTYTLPEDWKLQHIWTIGMIAVDDGTNKEFLNSCVGSMGPPRDPVVSITSETPPASMMESEATATNTITIQNISEVDDIFTIELIPSSMNPEDWSVELSATELSLAGGAEGSFDVTITSGETIGFAGAEIIIRSTVDPKSPKQKTSVTAVSAGISHLEVIEEKELDNSVLEFLGENTEYLQVDGKSVGKFYADLQNLQTIVWNVGENGIIKSGSGDAILGLIEQGVNLYFIGHKVAPGLEAEGVMDDLGLEYFGYSDAGFSEGMTPPYFCNLRGTENNVFSGEWFEKGIPTYRNSEYYHVFKLTDTENAIPYIHFKNDQTIYYTDEEGAAQTVDVSAEEAIVGAYTKIGESKVIVLGMHPNDFWNQSLKPKLFERPMQWFDGTLDAEDHFITKGDLSLWAYPNVVEVNTNVLFNIDSDLPQSVRISLFNTLGQEVKLLADKHFASGRHQMQLNVTDLPSGNYFIVLNGNNHMLSVPIIINK